MIYCILGMVHKILHHAIHVDEGSDGMMWRSLEEPPLGDQLDGGL